MNNPYLKQLLKEYEITRFNNQQKCEERINQFYEKNPDFKKIIDNINLTSISISKSILENNKENTNKLNKHLEELKNEKEKILSKLNIKDSFFFPDFSCKLCNDTGYLVSDNNIMCTCLKQKLLNLQYNKSNISNLSFENFSSFNEDVYSDKIDEKKYNSNISPRDNIKKIKNISENFISNFDDLQEKNLLFTGNTGLGKTFLTNCIANEVIKNGKTVLYQTAPVMLDSIIDYRFGKNNEFNYSDLLNVDLLIIDDLGTESQNNMKYSELFNILNTRLLNQNNHSTKTIISTNLSLDHLFKVYDERIFSRLVGYYNICKFYGDDIRYQKKTNKKK